MDVPSMVRACLCHVSCERKGSMSTLPLSIRRFQGHASGGAERLADAIRTSDRRLETVLTASLGPAIRTSFRLELCLPRRASAVLDDDVRSKIRALRAYYPGLLRHRLDDEIVAAYGAAWIRRWMPPDEAARAERKLLDADPRVVARRAEAASSPPPLAAAAAGAAAAVAGSDDPEAAELAAEEAELAAEEAAMMAEEAADLARQAELEFALAHARKAAEEERALAEQAAEAADLLEATAALEDDEASNSGTDEYAEAAKEDEDGLRARLRAAQAAEIAVGSRAPKSRRAVRRAIELSAQFEASEAAVRTERCTLSSG